MSNDESTQQDSLLAEAGRDPLHTILNEIRQSERTMERRLQQLEADVQQGQEEAIEKTAKKARRDRPVAFRQKAHHEKYDFNERVVKCFQKASEELTKPPMESSSLVKAKTALDQGMELLAAHQKVIKIANRSDFGWRVVAEYKEDELA